MKKIVSLILIFILAFSLCSCGETAQESGGLKIVCTAFPQYDYIKSILGTDSGLTLLVDDGGDLHSYEPTAQDIIAIGSADLFVYLGGVSDSWAEGALKSANNPDLKTVALMDTVDTLEEEYAAGMEHDHEHEYVQAHDGDHSGEDEHIWLSLKNAVKITEYLCNAVCEIDAQNAALYRENADKYIEKLNALDGEYQAVINSAARSTLLFADRFPFRYMTEDYSLTYYAAFAGCSSESEASFETMAFLIGKTKELNLPFILTIDGSDGSIAEMISGETGAKVLSFNSCQSVSAADIGQGVNYLNIMENNLEILREALN